MFFQSFLRCGYFLENVFYITDLLLVGMRKSISQTCSGTGNACHAYKSNHVVGLWLLKNVVQNRLYVYECLLMKSTWIQREVSPCWFEKRFGRAGCVTTRCFVAWVKGCITWITHLDCMLLFCLKSLSLSLSRSLSVSVNPCGFARFRQRWKVLSCSRVSAVAVTSGFSQCRQTERKRDREWNVGIKKQD